MTLADVARPTAGTAGTSGCSERDGIFTAQYTHAFQTAMSDDIARKHFVVFSQHRTEIGDKFLYLLYEVRCDVVLYTTNGVVVLNQASAGGCLEDVENLFTVAETVEESGQGSQVHAETREEQQVRVDALQFIHNGTDVLYSFAHFDAHRFFDTHTQGVAVLVCAQVIQAVGQCQCLWIGKAFAHLFDASVDVTAVYVQLLDDFPFQTYTETEHTVSGRMLRTDVDDVFIFVEQNVTLFYHATVGQFLVVVSHVVRFFVAHTERVEAFVIILAERMSYPVFTQIQTAHVRVTDEMDTEEVVCFAFVELGCFPDVAYTW